jgi:hypothetical protein
MRKTFLSRIKTIKINLNHRTSAQHPQQGTHMLNLSMYVCAKRMQVRKIQQESRTTAPKYKKEKKTTYKLKRIRSSKAQCTSRQRIENETDVKRNWQKANKMKKRKTYYNPQFIIHFSFRVYFNAGFSLLVGCSHAR